MGCWNQTCGLTQLYIRAGEEVLVVPLAQEPNLDDLCYTTPFWSPFALPFKSHYNDYGAGENSSGYGLELVLQFLKENLIEVEVGENQYHDIAVHRDAFNEDLFWEAIHEQRLMVPHRYRSGRNVQVNMVMIKQNVFDYLADHVKFHVYDYNRTTFTRKNEREYTFRDIINDLPALVDFLITYPAGSVDDLDLSDPEFSAKIKRMLTRLMFSSGGIGKEMHDAEEASKIPANEQNLAARWLQYSEPHRGGAGFPSSYASEIVLKLVESNDRDNLLTFLEGVLTVDFIDSVMMSTRKFWSPQAGMGSQQDEPVPYLDLNSAIAHAIELDRKRWDDDE